MRILRSGIVLAVMGLGLSLGTLSTSAQTDDGRYYPVVQIISYDMLHGTYPEMLGWGSASVVDDSGLLVSNNHVVVDGQDKEVDAFSICVTTSRAERPDCRFTAHVLDRDSTKDLSVLRIDPTDIFGEPVDFSLFRSLEIADDSELPDNLSSVTAVGYPWIGADTVSETTGIVSGTIEYNNAKYIKSDATIAGGNSGGALLDADGRLVGIPTFTIGYDTSLGYALWIGEARDFIENAAKNEATQKDSDTAFRENRRIVE
ncbi:MAG TPA: serine protease [bacterium]|nr:serine protease [bacterium]